MSAENMTNAIASDLNRTIGEVIEAERTRMQVTELEIAQRNIYSERGAQLVREKQRATIQGLESYPSKVTSACAETAAEFASLIQRDIERCKLISDFWGDELIREHRYGYPNPMMQFEKSYIHYLEGEY